MATEKNTCVKRWNYLTQNDSTLQVDNAVSITFANIGTWAARIDGKLVMPNGEYTDNLTGDNRIKHRYNIVFEFDTGIIDDAELEEGKHLLYNIWEDAE